MPEKILYPHKSIPILNEMDKDRFWTKVALTANNNLCWDWQANVSYKGYGSFHLKKSDYTAHRVSYFLHFKKDPLEMCVLHNCDNPKCVNPNHLFLGTNNDNVQDKVKKGRQARNVSVWKGVERPEIQKWNNPFCNLSETQWHEIKDMYVEGNKSYEKIGKMYGISKKSAMNIVRKMGGKSIDRSPLSITQILEIRSKYINERGIFNRLAKEYNIGSKTITDIVYRKTWKNI